MNKSMYRHYFVKGERKIRPRLKYRLSKKERRGLPEGKGTGRSYGSNARLSKLRRKS